MNGCAGWQASEWAGACADVTGSVFSPRSGMPQRREPREYNTENINNKLDEAQILLCWYWLIQCMRRTEYTSNGYGAIKLKMYSLMVGLCGIDRLWVY